MCGSYSWEKVYSLASKLHVPFQLSNHNCPPFILILQEEQERWGGGTIGLGVSVSIHLRLCQIITKAFRKPDGNLQPLCIYCWPNATECTYSFCAMVSDFPSCGPAEANILGWDYALFTPGKASIVLWSFIGMHVSLYPTASKFHTFKNVFIYQHTSPLLWLSLIKRKNVQGLDHDCFETWIVSQ